MSSYGRSRCERYDQAEGKLKSFTRSAVRTKIMLCLMDGTKEAGELERDIGLRASTILHSIKEMIEADLVQKADRGYFLTNIGRIQAALLNGLVDTIIVLDQHHDFWMNHDMSGVPLDLQTKVGMLIDSEVVAGDPRELLKAQEYFMEKVVESKVIGGVSPIIIPGYAEAIAIPVEKGAEVDLVLTSPILDIVIQEYGDVMRGLLSHLNFRLYRLDESIKVAFTVTDEHLYLGLYRLDNTYDLGNDLFCSGEGATKWGRALFEYYKSKSHLVKKI